MMTRGTQLGVEATVDGNTYDVPKGAGYGVMTEITVEGTPSEEAVMKTVWDSIKESGDLPVYVSTTLTWAGHEWPWTKVISKFDISYQAVHMAEGSILLAVATLIWALLPLVAEFLFILLRAVAITYVIMWAAEVAQWLADQEPEVIGISAGLVILAGLVLLGDEK